MLAEVRDSSDNEQHQDSAQIRDADKYTVYHSSYIIITSTY